ncbi:hypothetical protein [Bacillus alveayuensis]|uniref:hypothetical protein n=1 Tax=Aeribacillus alveayuensis TaxID=279215 RepID=UPI000A8592D6|nr:hypothetical protein [Bacillus alveayuensis]
MVKRGDVFHEIEWHERADGYKREIYVETFMNSNGFRNLIIKLLKEYSLKMSDYKIYLRADYSELNK